MKIILFVAFFIALASYWNLEPEKSRTSRGPASVEPILKLDPKPVGFVVDLKGRALLTRDSNELNVSIGSELFEGDKITTEERSFVRSKMVDGSVFNMGSNSEIVVSTYQVRNLHDRDVVIHHLKGMLRSHFINKNQKGKLEVRGGGAVFGVRGTEFITLVQDQSVKMILLEGLVEVSHPKMTTKLVYPKELFDKELDQVLKLKAMEFDYYQDMCLGLDQEQKPNTTMILNNPSDDFIRESKNIKNLSKEGLQRIVRSKMSTTEKRKLVELSPLADKKQLLGDLDKIDQHEKYVKNVLRKIQDTDTFNKLEPAEQERLQKLQTLVTKEKVADLISQDKAAVLITPDDKVVFFEDKPELMALLPRDDSGNVIGIKVDHNLDPIPDVSLKNNTGSLVDTVSEVVVPVVNTVGQVVLVPVVNRVEEATIEIPSLTTGEVAGVSISQLNQAVSEVLPVVSSEPPNTVDNNTGLIEQIVQPVIQTTTPLIQTVVPTVTKPLGGLLKR